MDARGRADATAETIQRLLSQVMLLYKVAAAPSASARPSSQEQGVLLGANRRGTFV